MCRDTVAEKLEEMSLKMTAHDDEAMAAADKEMEERANRVKHLLSQRYQGLKNDQVRFLHVKFFLPPLFPTAYHIVFFHGKIERRKNMRVRCNWNER